MENINLDNKLFYIGLSISSGILFSYLLKRLEDRKKTNQNENGAKLVLDKTYPKSSFSRLAPSLYLSKNVQSDASDISGVLTPG